MAEEKGSETLIYKAKDLEEANKLRIHLLNSVRRIWLFVSKTNVGDYAITASGQHGGKISESMAILLKDCCKKFMAPVVSPERECDFDADEKVETVEDLVENLGDK